MASDVLMYAQGQTATFTATFVTSPQGMPVDVPDATIQIIGPGGVEVLQSIDMIHVFTGFYFFDYPIPNSLPVNTYTVFITGTVMGTPTAMSIFLQVVPAGVVTPVSFSQNSAELLAAFDRYIGCAQHIPVYQELAIPNKNKDQWRVNWPRWNLGNHIIKVNNNMVTDGFTIDVDTGNITFGAPLHPTDRVNVSYNFRWFSQIDLLGFINDAISQINIEPSQNVMFTLDNFPPQFVGVLLQGAAANAIKALLLCLIFQEPQTVFGGPDRAKDAISSLQALKENYEAVFTKDKATLKKMASYPKISAVVQPEYTLPGGRSRWFRYLFSNNVG